MQSCQGRPTIWFLYIFFIFLNFSHPPKRSNPAIECLELKYNKYFFYGCPETSSLKTSFLTRSDRKQIMLLSPSENIVGAKRTSYSIRSLIVGRWTISRKISSGSFRSFISIQILTISSAIGNILWSVTVPTLLQHVRGSPTMVSHFAKVSDSTRPMEL